MASSLPTASFQPAEGPWADDVIELQVIRVLQQGDLSRRSPETAFLAGSPEIRFSIHLRVSGERVGRIHLRITDEPGIVDRLGHAGYAVDPEHRRQGHATRALHLLLDVARKHSLQEVVVLIEPDNTPSRRAVERAGFSFEGETDRGTQATGLGLGPKICRYSFEL